MRISITIMAHPKRMEPASKLYAKLLKQPFYVVNLTWDRKNDEWDTGSRAMRFGAVAGGDWHVVLQDDAIIPDNFYHHLESALKHAPDRTLISLYTGTVRPYAERVADAVKKAQSQNASWIKFNLMLWGVGMVIPTVHIEPMLEFVANMDNKYDIRVGMFYQRNMLPIFYTNPSLVDHDNDLGSLLASDSMAAERVAHNFISGEPEWNSQFVDL